MIDRCGDIDRVWARIKANAGQEFLTISGFPFTYEVPGNYLRVSRTIRNLSRSNLSKALELVPAARVEVKQVPTLPSSGRAQWSRNRWLLLVDSDEAPVRQRFSLGHELAHVIFHPLSDVVFYPVRGRTAEQWEEQACEYFSACLLMPRMWVKRAWGGGMRGVPDLARLFDVSYLSMQIRLEQIGLVEREQTGKRSAA